MTEQFKILYKDNVVVEILLVTPQKGQVRKVRSLKAVEETSAIVSVEFWRTYLSFMWCLFVLLTSLVDHPQEYMEHLISLSTSPPKILKNLEYFALRNMDDTISINHFLTMNIMNNLKFFRCLKDSLKIVCACVWGGAGCMCACMCLQLSLQGLIFFFIFICRPIWLWWISQRDMTRITR